MPLFEDRSASFIVRVWCERGDGDALPVRTWRGSTEHVPSGQRMFFQELDAVIAFMRPHLLALGIDEPNRFWERMADLTGSPPERAFAAASDAGAAASATAKPRRVPQRTPQRRGRAA